MRLTEHVTYIGNRRGAYNVVWGDLWK